MNYLNGWLAKSQLLIIYSIIPYKVINIQNGKTVKKCVELINDNNNVIFLFQKISKKRYLPF